MVVNHRTGSPLEAARVGQAYDLSRWLAAQPAVSGVQSVMDLSPDTSREEYQRFVKVPMELWPEDMRHAVAQIVGEHIMVFAVSTKAPAGSDEARAELRAVDGRGAADGSARWREVAELGTTLERRLLGLLFETELGPVTQRYAVL